MTVKKIKPSTFERRNRTLRKRVDQLLGQRTQMTEAFNDFKRNATEKLEEYIRGLRVANDSLARSQRTLADNNMHIIELEGQVAVQYKEKAEVAGARIAVKMLNQDVRQEKAANLIAHREIEALKTEVISLRLRLIEAEKSVFEKAADAISSWVEGKPNEA